MSSSSSSSSEQSLSAKYLAMKAKKEREKNCQNPTGKEAQGVTTPSSASSPSSAPSSSPSVSSSSSSPSAFVIKMSPSVNSHSSSSRPSLPVPLTSKVSPLSSSKPPVSSSSLPPKSSSSSPPPSLSSASSSSSVKRKKRAISDTMESSSTQQSSARSTPSPSPSQSLSSSSSKSPSPSPSSISSSSPNNPRLFPRSSSSSPSSPPSSSASLPPMSKIPKREQLPSDAAVPAASPSPSSSSSSSSSPSPSPSQYDYVKDSGSGTFKVDKVSLASTFHLSSHSARQTPSSSPPSSSTPPPSPILLLQSILHTIIPPDIMRHFSLFGKIVDFQITNISPHPHDKEYQSYNSFITFANPDSVTMAIEMFPPHDTFISLHFGSHCSLRMAKKSEIPKDSPKGHLSGYSPQYSTLEYEMSTAESLANYSSALATNEIQWDLAVGGMGNMQFCMKEMGISPVQFKKNAQSLLSPSPSPCYPPSSSSSSFSPSCSFDFSRVISESFHPQFPFMGPSTMQDMGENGQFNLPPRNMVGYKQLYNNIKS